MQKGKTTEKFKLKGISPHLLRELDLLLHENETVHRVVRGRIGQRSKQPWVWSIVTIAGGVVMCQRPLAAVLDDFGSPALIVFVAVVVFSILALFVLYPRRYQVIYAITNERILEIGQHLWLYSTVLSPDRMRFTQVRATENRGDIVLDCTGVGRSYIEFALYDVEFPEMIAALIRETYGIPEYSELKTPANPA